MTPKKRPPAPEEGSSASPFTSFRIIGKRVQDLQQKLQSTRSSAPRLRTTRSGGREEIVARIPMTSILRATLIVLAVVLGAWLIVNLRDKIILLCLGFFVAAIIDPGVRQMERIGIPRGIAILCYYAVAAIMLIFLLLSLIPIVAEQVTSIAQYVSDLVDGFLSNPLIHIPLLPAELNDRLTTVLRSSLENLAIRDYTDALERWGEDLSGFAQGSVLFATRLAGSIVSFIVNIIVVLVLAFFIQIEKESIRRWIRGFFPPHARQYMDGKMEIILAKISQWVRGQLILGVVVGTLVFLALTILGMPYALTLAMLAGFTEFIPYMGPFIAAVPSVLIALTQGGFLWAVVVAGVYYVVQWCENNLLVPLIMKRAVGLSPIAIIFAMLVGVSFPTIVHPVLGILLAIPFTTILAIFLEDLREKE